MTAVSDGLKDVFLAGVGAMALGAEKTREFVDSLIAKGEITVEQGNQINSELLKQTEQTMEAASEKAQETAHIASVKAQETAEHVAEQAKTAAVLAKEQGESVLSTARSQTESALHTAHEQGTAFADALRHDILEAQMAAMTPEQRAEFAAKATEIASRDSKENA